MVEKIVNYLKKHFTKEHLKKRFVTGPKTIPIVLLSLIIVTVIICSNRKIITVSIDGNDKIISTFSNTYRNALANNNIKIGPKDKVTINLDDEIVDGAKLSIKRAVNVQVDVDGKNWGVQSAEDNINKMLFAEGIGLQDLDKVYPSKDTALSEGLKVVVTRVEAKEVKEVKPIDYTTIVKKDDSMEEGSKKVIQEGQPGEKETTVRIIYENGKEVARQVISELVKRQPKQKIVAMGTSNVYTPSRGGSITYANSMKMRATAYTAGYESTGKSPGDPGFGITATGTVAKRNSSSYSSVAVDPRVIPLGTKLYVEGYGYAIAEDTGGAIKGNRIDVFFNSSVEANNWGAKWVNVYVVK